MLKALLKKIYLKDSAIAFQNVDNEKMNYNIDKYVYNLYLKS